MSALSDAHGGTQAVTVASGHGVDTLFTLSGAHVFPVYDGAVTADPPAAAGRRAPRADRRVRRRGAGQADPHARPGRGHRRSRCHQRGQRRHHRLLQRLAGRGARWPRPRLPLGAGGAAGAGPSTAARPGHQARRDRARRPVASPAPSTTRSCSRVVRTGGRSSSTCRWTTCSHQPTSSCRGPPMRRRPAVTPTRPTSPRWVGSSRRPTARCWFSAPTCGPTAPRRRPAGWPRRCASRSSPTAWGAASCPGGHPLLVTRARSAAFAGADLVVVVGAPLDFRLGFGASAARTVPSRLRSCTSSTPRPAGQARRAGRLGAGDLTLVLDGVLEAWTAELRRADPLGLGRPAAGVRRRGRGEGRRAAGQRPPTRSIRPGSTASWFRGSPTTR